MKALPSLTVMLDDRTLSASKKLPSSRISQVTRRALQLQEQHRKCQRPEAKEFVKSLVKLDRSLPNLRMQGSSKSQIIELLRGIKARASGKEAGQFARSAPNQAVPRLRLGAWQ